MKQTLLLSLKPRHRLPSRAGDGQRSPRHLMVAKFDELGGKEDAKMAYFSKKWSSCLCFECFVFEKMFKSNFPHF